MEFVALPILRRVLFYNILYKRRLLPVRSGVWQRSHMAEHITRPNGNCPLLLPGESAMDRDVLKGV